MLDFYLAQSVEKKIRNLAGYTISNTSALSILLAPDGSQ